MSSRLAPHPALRQHRSIWREFHLIRESGGAILADGRKAQIRNFHHRVRPFFMKTRDRKARKPQHFLHFREAPRLLNKWIGKRVRIIAVLKSLEAAGGRCTLRVPEKSVAQVHAEFIDAARDTNQSVPAPNGRRQRKRAASFHLKIFSLSKLLDTSQRDMVRIRGPKKLGDSERQPRTMPVDDRH